MTEIHLRGDYPCSGTLYGDGVCVEPSHRRRPGLYMLKVLYAVAAPGALIGASNFFELAVATAISALWR